MLFTLAWRNIWRNRRRTLITAAAVMFAVFFSVFMESIQRGAWNYMLDSVINFYYGYVQVHEKGYWAEPSVDASMTYDSSLAQQLQGIPGLLGVSARIETFALAANEEQTTGVLVVGVDPAAEDSLTRLASRLQGGSYWKNAAAGQVLIADGVAARLGIGLGDTLILLSQGYHGANAAGKYPVGGLLHFGSPDLNKRMVYLPRMAAARWLDASGRATSLALRVADKRSVPGVVAGLQSRLDTSRYEVMRWEQLLPELLEAKALDSASSRIVMLVLYLIIAFGVFGTILMMLKEREREMGVLIGIGMRRRQLAMITWVEILLMSSLGVVAGIALSLPVVLYFHHHPIDLMIMGESAVKAYEKFGFEAILPASVDVDIFTSQALIILAITSVLAIYPFWRIARMDAVRSMRA